MQYEVELFSIELRQHEINFCIHSYDIRESSTPKLPSHHNRLSSPGVIETANSNTFLTYNLAST